MRQKRESGEYQIPRQGRHPQSRPAANDRGIRKSERNVPGSKCWVRFHRQKLGQAG